MTLKKLVMKYVILLFFAFGTVFSQSQAERDFIISKSNPNEVALLKAQLEATDLQNKKEVREFLLTHPHIDNKLNLQRIIDGVPIFYKEDNNVLSVQTLRADTMYPGGSLGLAVTGLGMTAGVWDGGKVRDTHVELAGRITLGDGATSLSSHGTHVTGTIIAGGVSAIRRGFAYQANAKTYDWTSDISEVNAFAGQGFLVSNHSYGNIASGLATGTFGAYGLQAIEVDQIMNVFPYYQMVKSAGNDRNDTNISQVVTEGGYDLLSGVSTAKNVITVAAVEGILTNGSDNTFVMSSFSNYGPPDDGRIKPDIAAKGVAVSSCISVSNSAYQELQGTSMAAPAITGLITLLQKHYNNLNTGTYMRAASVKGLICHTAREAGDLIGPDYSFGWGVADGFEAAKVITNANTTSILEERTLNSSQVFTKNFVVNTTQNIRVSIAWTDPTGNSNSTTDDRTPRLINNLDLKVIKDGTTYYPWKLNPDAIFDLPTNNSDNDADNIERVEIFNAVPGTYTIQVSHKGTLQGGLQNYTLITNGTTGISLSNDDFVVDNQFFVYPSPAKDELHFSNTNNLEIDQITVNDISGKLVYQTTSETSAINVSNFQSGVYFIRFTTQNKTIIKKFIKE